MYSLIIINLWYIALLYVYSAYTCFEIIRYFNTYYYINVPVPSKICLYYFIDSVHNFYVPPGMTGGTLCFWVVRPSFRLSVRHALGVPHCMQRPAKAMPFQQIIMHALHYQHDVDVHLLFCVDLDLHITSLTCRSSLMGTTLRAAPSKSHAFFRGDV